MITDLLSEEEFRRVYTKWRCENDLGVTLPPGISFDEFASDYPLPGETLEHTQSGADADGCITTLLKGEIVLKEWQSRGSGGDKTFVWYKVIKTPAGEGREPFTAGYIAVL